MKMKLIWEGELNFIVSWVLVWKFLSHSCSWRALRVVATEKELQVSWLPGNISITSIGIATRLEGLWLFGSNKPINSEETTCMILCMCFLLCVHQSVHVQHRMP
jgi:hypothetical protein